MQTVNSVQSRTRGVTSGQQIQVLVRRSLAFR